MSNTTVGAVYDHIIQEVINAVRVDFEENGVDDGILEELKKGWQHKLSQLNVAQFPWDPKPEPQPAPAPAANTAPANTAQQAANYPQSTLSPQASAQPVPVGQHPNGNGVGIKAENDPVIKQEPGATSMPGPMAYNTAGQPRGGMAALRAAQALENRYGQRAAASIDAIQSGQVQAQAQAQGQHHAQQLAQQQAQRPGQIPQQMSQQQYRQGVAASMQQRMPQQPPNGLPQTQVDGASDEYEGVLLHRGADGRTVEMGRVEIDNFIHSQIAARAKEMEGGGLMLPLKAATRPRRAASKTLKQAGPSRVDGPDDDDDDDDDAINSDLDDPEDARDEDEDDDDSMGHMMLCMYDKVQRVKNKWKCTLKDGVLTVNGREYVFHKATGEYEW